MSYIMDSSSILSISRVSIVIYQELILVAPVILSIRIKPILVYIQSTAEIVLYFNTRQILFRNAKAELFGRTLF